MPDRRDPPPTDEGWYALHDFRTVDWDAWQSAPEHERSQALEDGAATLRTLVDVADAEEGATAIYSILGHKADLLFVHLRPTTAHLDAIERGFEQTDLARFTEQVTSYVSVTEASGYSERARDYFEGDLDESSGLANYIRSRLHPTIPDAEHVCFYPMDKRRDPEQNWYALPFDERAEHMAAHGDIGRDYGGRVTQMITGSIGLDDWEWGVTLWADDLVDVKDLLYEMRFDASTAEFADFGTFYVGRRVTPDDLPALLSGEPVGMDEDDGSASVVGDQSGSAPEATDAVGSRANGTAAADSAGGANGDDSEGRPAGPPSTGGDGVETESVGADALTARLAKLGLHADSGFEPGQHAVVCYSDADAQELATEVSDLSEQFDHYDSHVGTSVRAQAGRSAVASVWETERAADTAAGFLTDLPGVTESVSGPLGAGVGAADDGGGAGDGGGARDEGGADAEEPDDASRADADSEESEGTGSEEPTAAGVGTDTTDRSTAQAIAEASANADTSEATDDDSDTTDAEAGDATGSTAGEPAAARGDDAGTDSGTDTGTDTETDAGGSADAGSIRSELADRDVYAGKPHGEDIFALVLYSEADEGELVPAVEDLSDGFDRYDTHEGTDVYVEVGGNTAAVVSLWATEAAADTASEYLTDLPGVVGWADDREGFGTMGMFYTVKPKHREDFVETFAEVGDLLGDMKGHRETSLLANVTDENDMFIASQWDAREDAMAFFRSEAFRDTVTWGRDVLADRPRHVFLA